MVLCCYRWAGGQGAEGAFTSWALAPQRLAEAADPETRRFYSQWHRRMQAFSEANFSDEFVQANAKQLNVVLPPQ